MPIDAESMDALGRWRPPPAGAGGAAWAPRVFSRVTAPGGTTLAIAPSLDHSPPGVIRVCARTGPFLLGGDEVHDVLVAGCNVNFAARSLTSRPLIMTLMIASRAVVPQTRGTAASDRHSVTIGSGAIYFLSIPWRFLGRGGQ